VAEIEEIAWRSSLSFDRVIPCYQPPTQETDQPDERSGAREVTVNSDRAALGCSYQASTSWVDHGWDAKS